MFGSFKRWLVLLAGALLIGCGSTTTAPAAPAIEVTATEFRFAPATIALKTGAPAKLTLNNRGQMLHDFTIVSGPQIATPQAHGDNHDDRGPYHVAAEAGRQASLTLDLPPGEYTFACTVPGHQEAGMRGALTVTQ